jgi:hypothetical protein
MSGSVLIGCTILYCPWLAGCNKAQYNKSTNNKTINININKIKVVYTKKGKVKKNMTKEKIFAIDEVWTVHETRFYKATSLKEARKLAGKGNYIGITLGNFEDFIRYDSIEVLTNAEQKEYEK